MVHGKVVARWAVRAGLVVATVAIFEYLVLPQLILGRAELRLFADAQHWLLGIAFVLEAASLVFYSMLSRALIAASVRLSFGVQFRVDLTGLGASHVLPGGGASASAVRYRLMVNLGVPTSDAVSMAAVETALGVVALVATFTGGVILASPGIWSHPDYLVGGIAGGAALTAAYLVLVRYPGRHAVSVQARHLAGHSSATTALLGRLATAVREGARRADVLLRDRNRRRQILILALGNWVLDAACLWLCLFIYGITVNPAVLLVAYGAANLAGLLPITPGGLGIIEGVLIPTLTAFDVAGGPAVLGVLTWRALEFWLPIPIAGLTYLSLRPWSHRSVV